MCEERVSVIMGAYNCASTLEEAVQSIKNQTYTNWELIICDDGSTDDTFEIAKKLAKSDSRIVLLQNEVNVGLNKTLNKCLSKVSGVYVARMDGDDISIPERFEKEISFLKHNSEYDFVSSWMALFDENGEFGVVKYKELVDKYDLAQGSAFCHASVLMRKNAYDGVGGYTESIRAIRVEDVDLWFKLYSVGCKGYNIQEVLYKMRDDRNASHRRKLKYRFNSTYTRIVGMRRLNMPLRFYPRAFIPVLIGLVPTPIYRFVHNRRYRKK